MPAFKISMFIVCFDICLQRARCPNLQHLLLHFFDAALFLNIFKLRGSGCPIQVALCV
jgi:hypothetical protein